MFRILVILFLAVVFAGPATVSPANAQTRMVKTKPTPATMAAGESVLFDDKSCPAGMIARYTKSQRKEQIGKRCVHLNGTR
ncbi:DUF6719 family protein [Neorhizobium galegae]|jgi:hypothetical protein|uniref:DUF6719 family protein n=1 Tax=Neorhizobium galegae TaxID=399 RepID=UPI0021054D90|nr:DUF6719 family protein [Neorhizobium galegae]MCQ1837502.1 hypothetical protein [Neorhizobium galegae]UIY29137.1 hypothetical protein LZK73_21600 [Neorhizobium galegae]